MCRPCTPWGLICPLPSTSARTEVKKGLEREGEGRDRDKETERESTAYRGGTARTCFFWLGWVCWGGDRFSIWKNAVSMVLCRGSEHVRRIKPLPKGTLPWIAEVTTRTTGRNQTRHNEFVGWMNSGSFKKKWNTCGYSSYLINWTCDITWLNII